MFTMTVNWTTIQQSPNELYVAVWHSTMNLLTHLHLIPLLVMTVCFYILLWLILSRSSGQKHNVTYMYAYITCEQTIRIFPVVKEV